MTMHSGRIWEFLLSFRFILILTRTYNTWALGMFCIKFWGVSE